MTVKELFEKLRKVDENMIVVVSSGDEKLDVKGAFVAFDHGQTFEDVFVIEPE